MRHRLLKFAITFAFSCATGYCMAQAASPDLPAVDPWIEKGGVWGLTGMLMWWILGRFSRQLDGLTTAVEKLTEKLSG